MGAPVSTGVAAAMGSPSGGINPTEREFIDSRRRDIAFQSFIDRAIKEDPRTRTMGNMLLDSVYGNDTRAKTMAMARIGGPDAYQGLVGTVMNTPGLSGYFGGSARSLAVGSLAVGTSGLTMNGYGVFGDKSMNLRFADEMMRQVNSRFYGANGNPILSMTNGLNRDQLGGVMVQAASQGAFSGMDMGSFQKLDAAGRTSKFIANGDTVQKITEFMKSATKALGSLIDVYGNISSGELMQKAQQITGLDLSRLENVNLMSSRLQQLRSTARATGIDNQSMFDYAARATDYSSAIGMRPEAAGTIGVFAARQGMLDYRARQMNTSNVPGFYSNSVSPMEMIQSVARDQVALSRDPLGARFYALEKMIGDRGLDATTAAGLRSRASGFGASAAGVGAFDRMFQDQFGTSAPMMINAMGGTDNLIQQMSPTQQDTVARMASANQHDRQSRLILSKIRRGGTLFGGTIAQQNALHSLVTTFNNGTIGQLLDPNTGDDALAGIAGQVVDPSTVMGSIQTVRGMGAGGLQAYHSLRSVIQANELTKGFQSTESRMRLQTQSMTEVDAGTRGQLLGGGFMAGMMDKYTGNDPLSQLMRLQRVRPDQIAGIHGDISLDFGSFIDGNGSLNPARWQKSAQQWAGGLLKTPEGRAIYNKYNMSTFYGDVNNPVSGKYSKENLLRFYNDIRDPNTRQDLMSGFSFYSLNGGKATAFTRSENLERMNQYANAEAMIAMAKDGSVHGAEKDWLLTSAAGLETGLIYGADSKGRSRSRGVATPEQLAHMSSDFVSRAVSHIISGDLSSKTLAAIAQSSNAGSVLDALKTSEDALQSDFGPGQGGRDKKLKNIRTGRAGLATAASSQKLNNATGGGAINGTLKIEGNPDIVLKFMNTVLTPPGGK